MTEFNQLTAGRWKAILIQLGIDQKYLTGKHCACPMCGGKDRFRFTDHNADGMYYCNQCGSGNGWQLAQWITGKPNKKLAGEILDMVGGIKPTSQNFVDNFEKNRVWLKKIIDECVKCDISPVSKYLKSRHLKQNSALHFHPALPYFDKGKMIGKYPAMIAKISTPQAMVASLHVTYLSQSGSKADVVSPRKIMPKCRPLAGGAIRLCPADAVMGIAEGIETALAVTEMTGIPCWSAVNATMLEKFEPPDFVSKLYIYADCDWSYTGEAAAYSLAKRLSNKMEICVRVPKNRGTDFADEWEKQNGKSTLDRKQ